MATTTMFRPNPSVKVGHLNAWQLLLVFVCMHSMKHFMGAGSQALPQYAAVGLVLLPMCLVCGNGEKYLLKFTPLA